MTPSWDDVNLILYGVSGVFFSGKRLSLCARASVQAMSQTKIACFCIGDRIHTNSPIVVLV